MDNISPRKQRSDKGQSRKPYKRGPGLTKDRIPEILEENDGVVIITQRNYGHRDITNVRCWVIDSPNVYYEENAYKGKEPYGNPTGFRKASQKQVYAFLYNHFDELAVPVVFVCSE